MTILDEIDAEQSKLDMIDTQLYVALESIEAALHQRITSRVAVNVASDHFQVIAFGKHDGQWRLLVDRGNGFESLRSASREARADALAGGHIARLITEAATILRARMTQRAAATQAATDILTMLGAHQGDPT